MAGKRLYTFGIVLLMLVSVIKPTYADIRKISPSLLKSLGVLDVTAAPYNADPTGKRDSTKAIQHAVNVARDKQMICFFPSGIYLVSNTIECVQNPIDPSTGKVIWRREFPCVLWGSHTGNSRPTVLLAPHAPGFGNPKKPKAVIHFWARDFIHQKPNAEQDNASMYQMLVHMNVVIGAGNLGAIAVRHRAAQGSGVQDCMIDATNGYIGLQGGAGSGGSHIGLTIVGGKIGLDLRESQPSPTIAGITLIGQTQSAILYDGEQTLSAAGIRIEMHQNGPAIVGLGDKPRDAPNGAISLVDSIIEFNNTNSPSAGSTKDNSIAIQTSRGLTLHNVYLHNYRVAVRIRKGQTVVGNPAGWMRIDEYAHRDNPQPYRTGKPGLVYQFDGPIYIDGATLTQDLLRVNNRIAPPADLISRHIWRGTFPSWEDPAAINVKSAPFYAKGDGVSDDSAAIQRAINSSKLVVLPKGVYRISRPIQLKSDTQLIGVGRHLSQIVVFDTPHMPFTSTGDSLPAIETANSKDAHTVIAFLDIRVPCTASCAYCLHWRCGRNSICRAVNTSLYDPHPGHTPDSIKIDHPLVVVSGNGGGHWYEFIAGTGIHEGPNYRHLFIDGTHEPFFIYQCNPEHSRGDANVEMKNASSVSIYGLKSEGNYCVMIMQSCDNCSVFGYGGNANPFPGKELFRIDKSSNFLLSNIWQKPRVPGENSVDYFAGIGTDPRRWVAINETTSSGAIAGTVPMERPVLYQRGSPSIR